MAITNSSRPGVWTATVPNVQPGDAYVFAITPTATTAASSAPLLRVDPNGLEITDDGLASIVPQPYVFRNPRLLPPPLPQAIIYELHVPSFTADGTFQAAEAQLPHLAALGVTTIELMPIAYNGPAATSAGQWGYGPWTALAVRPSLGGWRGLQHFVDAAAGHNLSVLVDVVLNHESQQTLLKNFDGWSGGANGIYFYPPGTAAQTPWGPRPAFGSPPVAQYLLNTLNTLMEQAHIGGFRWDSTSCIRMSGDSSGGSCSQNNPDGWALLRAGADSARAQSALSIAEDTWGTPEPRIVSRADHGAGFDAVWGYSTFHFPAVDEITQADDSQIAVATVASACVAGSALLDPQHTIIFTENHDVSSNQHAGRIPQRVDPSNSTVAGSLYWAEKKSLLLLGLLMTCPGTPMLLQGQELLTFDSFDFPNPPKLDWSRAASYSGFLGAVQQLGQLRRVEAALSGGDARVLSTTDTDDDKILVFARTAAGAAPIVVVANMRKHTYVGSSAVALTNMPVDGVWSVRFSSDNASISPLFDGACSGPGNTTVHISGGAGALCVPPMAVLILEHQGVLAHEGAPLAEAPRPPVRDDKVVRLMIFAGEGTGGPNSSPRLRLEAADAEGLIRVAITPALNASEVESQLSTDNFDAILFPGGSGSHEADGLTEAGRQRVRDFVAAGGGYVGICAGGYLATANFSWSLDFINVCLWLHLFFFPESESPLPSLLTTTHFLPSRLVSRSRGTGATGT